MTSYTEEIIECPQCKKQFRHMALGSYNTFGATFWTDGYVDGDMFVDWSPLLICPYCNRFLWRDELTVIDSEDNYRYPREWVSDPLLNRAVSVYEPHYLEIVRQSLWRNPDEEVFARIRVWRYWNQPFRENPDLPFEVTPAAEANLRRILELLPRPCPEEVIIKAEILRELGQFEDCLRLLDMATTKGNGQTAAAIRRLAEASERRVAALN